MIKLKEIIGKERIPPRAGYDNPDDEMFIALKQPFTAMDYALRYGPNPKLFAVIRGSPYERDYVRRFGK